MSPFSPNRFKDLYYFQIDGHVQNVSIAGSVIGFPVNYDVPDVETTFNLQNFSYNSSLTNLWNTERDTKYYKNHWADHGGVDALS